MNWQHYCSRLPDDLEGVTPAEFWSVRDDHQPTKECVFAGTREWAEIVNGPMSDEQASSYVTIRSAEDMQQMNRIVEDYLMEKYGEDHA